MQLLGCLELLLEECIIGGHFTHANLHVDIATVIPCHVRPKCARVCVNVCVRVLGACLITTGIYLLKSRYAT